MASIPVIDTPNRGSSVPLEVASRHGAIALLAISAVLVLGTFIDLGVLWIGQRQPSAQWEFVALANTIEGFWALVLAAALSYVAMLVGGSKSAAGYRILGIGVLGIGLAGGGLGLLLASDYLALRPGIPPEGMALLTTTTFKGLGLSALYFLVLTPLGFLGLRLPSNR